jgi:hypothetical protein
MRVMVSQERSVSSSPSSLMPRKADAEPSRSDGEKEVKRLPL